MSRAYSFVLGTPKNLVKRVKRTKAVKLHRTGEKAPILDFILVEMRVL
jgi:hypothetical protein